jgi:hypothetical protein
LDGVLSHRDIAPSVSLSVRSEKNDPNYALEFAVENQTASNVP